MSQRELELTKLKESMKVLKAQNSALERPKGGPVIALAPVNRQAMTSEKTSPVSKQHKSEPEKDTKISQLERDLANLNEILTLHRQVEQDLNKKLRLLEKSKTKDDVNYEYIKNIFTKYVLFTAKNSAAEARQMEILLFDLLHYTKQEKEDLEKMRQPRTTAGFFSLFSGANNGNDAKASVPGITGSYTPQTTGRSQSLQRLPQKPNKASTESSFNREVPGDFTGISSTDLAFRNNKPQMKK